MQGAPISIVLAEILKRTPPYVWAILATLVVLGILQMRDQTVGRARVLLLPVALGAYSLWSALAIFGGREMVVAAWAVGMGLMLSLARRVPWPHRVEFLPADDAFAIGGSMVPLVAMLGVFAARYVATVLLILNPQWRGIEAVAIAGGLGYGVLAGIFAMRARNILAHGRRALRVSVA